MSEEVETKLQPLLEDEPADQIILRPKPRRRPRRRTWIITLVVVLLAGLAAGGGIYLRNTSQSAVQFSQAAASTGNLAVKISATGPVNPNAEYDMNFLTSGSVKEIDVHIGQQVKKGQVLARLQIDKTSLENTIAQDQLGMTSAQDSLNAAGTALDNTEASNAAALKVARDDEKKALAACQSGGGSGSSGTPTPTPSPECKQLARDQYAQAQRQAEASNASAQNSVASAQDSLNSAAAQLQAAQNNLNDAIANEKMTAPVDATVASINGVIGQNIGSSSSSAFMVLTDTRKLSIAAQVNEADIGNIQVGQSAQFTVAAYPSQTFRASVSAIETVGQTSSNVVSYKVDLAVDQNSLQGARVYSGMTATVSITTAERIGVVLIPNAALSFLTTALQSGEVDRTALAAVLPSQVQGSGTAQGSRRIVLELRNGKLVPVSITTGLTDGQYTEVLSGLHSGDRVVVGQTGGSSNSPGTGPSSGQPGSGTSGGPGSGPIQISAP